jgi:O-antigen/teichoic acid export membrane protein
MVAIFAPFVVALLGGQRYTGAISVLRIMAPIPILVTTAIFLSQLVMANIGLTRDLMRIYLLVGLVNLLLLPPLILRYAANGAALALLVAETAGPVLMLTAVWRHERGGWGAGPTPPAAPPGEVVA